MEVHVLGFPTEPGKQQKWLSAIPRNDKYSLTEKLSRGRLFMLQLLFLWGFLPIMYIASNLFRSPSAGFTKIVIFNMVTGVLTFFLANTLLLLNVTVETGKTLDKIFLVFPQYCYVTALQKMYELQISKKLCNECKVRHCLESVKIKFCPDTEKGFYTWDSPGIGKRIISISTVGLILFVVHTIIESRIIIKLFYFSTRNRHQAPSAAVEIEDTDVAEEKRKIKNANRDELLSYTLVLQDVTKYYKKFLAVNSLCLGVKNYECFGLLGINGAGKTTTFMMMTGDTRISYGDCFVKGFSIKRKTREVQKYTGYCPQFDALLDDMTTKETIIMYGLLRGFRYNDCKTLADSLARDLDFSCYLNKQVNALSGGNRRKLSTAIAILGDPPVMCFDEPTTGMDPASKRYIWDALCKIRDNGKCLVLTSHSMEECEALCTRIAIMVNGQFKCLGSVQHLKNTFTKGYHLNIKVRKPMESLTVNTGPLEEFINSQFPKAKLKEQHEELLYYHIKDTTRPWSDMFGIMEKAKKSNYNIEDYSLGQSSLEQVFLSFTKQQQ